mgnify:CR=1 FL=1
MELQRRAPGPVWIVGPERDAPLYAGLDLQRADSVEDAAFISVTGPYDDRTETPEHYRERLAAARARNPERFATNRDPKILAIPPTAWINQPADNTGIELAA